MLANRSPLRKRESDPPCFNGFGEQSSAGKILLHLGVRKKLPFKKAGCFFKDEKEPRVLASCFRVNTRKLNSGARGKYPERADEIETLKLLHKGEDVAFSTASEAVIGVAHRLDEEGRRPLVMKRTAPLERGAGAFQLHITSDEVGDVKTFLYLFHR